MGTSPSCAARALLNCNNCTLPAYAAETSFGYLLRGLSLSGLRSRWRTLQMLTSRKRTVNYKREQGARMQFPQLI
jgi:hypothetical protein